MFAEILSSLGMLMGSAGIFLYLIKLQNAKLAELDDKKLDKEMFKEHLKSFGDLKNEVKDIRKEMGDIRHEIGKNTELLIRVDERIAKMR